MSPGASLPFIFPWVAPEFQHTDPRPHHLGETETSDDRAPCGAQTGVCVVRPLTCTLSNRDWFAASSRLCSSSSSRLQLVRASALTFSLRLFISRTSL